MKWNVKTKQNTTPCCQPAAASCVVNSEPPSIISSSPSSPKLSSPSSFKSSSSSSSSTPMEAAETLDRNKFILMLKAEPSFYLLTIMPVEVTTDVRPLESVMVWPAPPLLMEFILWLCILQCLFIFWQARISLSRNWLLCAYQTQNVQNIMLSPRQFVLMRRNWVERMSIRTSMVCVKRLLSDYFW